MNLNLAVILILFQIITKYIYVLGGGESTKNDENISQTPPSGFNDYNEISTYSRANFETIDSNLVLISRSSAYFSEDDPDIIDPTMPENRPIEMCRYDEQNLLTNKYGDCYSSCDEGYLNVIDRTEKAMICCCGI